MKRIIAFLCFTVLAAACTNQPVNTATSNTNSGNETKSMAPPSEADIIAKEKAAWDAFKRKDADAFKKMLTPDYIEIHDGGVKETAAILTDMKDVELSDVTFADWKMTTIDKDLVLLTYTTTQKGTYKGQAIPSGPYHDAAAYVNRNGEWLAAYFQETLSQKMEPPPPPPAKKETSSPASSPAKPPETGPDPIANEKIVWDLFRAKNWDGFASLLAPEFMEVEPTGAYDKAGSVKGLQEMPMDMNQFELSDWKSIKFDEDSALVAYTVTMKGPKPMTDYHASIWAKRDGKWLAFYHQGTPAAGAAPAASPEMKMSPEKKMSPQKKM